MSLDLTDWTNLTNNNVIDQGLTSDFIDQQSLYYDGDPKVLLPEHIPLGADELLRECT